jgi:beta-1,4-mannosyl-glycoprotein beta-1,4-N-acetylglucosaminyltransferase
MIAAFVQLDLLEPRLKELDNVAARFVVAKAPVTLSVAAKPLMFADNPARFERYASRQQA